MHCSPLIGRVRGPAGKRRTDHDGASGRVDHAEVGDLAHRYRSPVGAVATESIITLAKPGDPSWRAAQDLKESDRIGGLLAKSLQRECRRLLEAKHPWRRLIEGPILGLRRVRGVVGGHGIEDPVR
jgi:hypothetical protein